MPLPAISFMDKRLLIVQMISSLKNVQAYALYFPNLTSNNGNKHY